MSKRRRNKRKPHRVRYNTKIEYDLMWSPIDFVYLRSPHLVSKKYERWDYYERDQVRRELRPPVEFYKSQVTRDDERFSGHEGTDRDIKRVLRERELRNDFYRERKVMVCERRKTRREVLFKKRLVGKGRKVSPIRFRNDDSEIKCRKVG